MFYPVSTDNGEDTIFSTLEDNFVKVLVPTYFPFIGVKKTVYRRLK